MVEECGRHQPQDAPIPPTDPVRSEPAPPGEILPDPPADVLVLDAVAY